MPGDQSETQQARTREPGTSRGESRAPVVRASLDQAIAWIEAQAARFGPEEIALDEGAGRVVASEILAPAPLPPLDRAAADGYALRAAETVGASDYNPLTLALCETAGPLPVSTAVPIVAGAALPRGADAILPAEPGQVHGEKLEVFGAIPQGSGIVRQGQHGEAGATLVEAGRVLLPQHLGMLALSGIERVQVWRRPRVRLCVFPPKSLGAQADVAMQQCAESPAGPSGDANTPMLRALVARDGGVVIESAVESKKIEACPGETAPFLPKPGGGVPGAPVFGVLGWRSGVPLRETLVHAITSPDADLVLIAGRSGHGADDFALQMIAERGELAIHGVAMRPGGSASMGAAHGVPVLLLPGDPLECWAAYEMLAGRLIRRMAGRWPQLPYAMQRAEVGHKIVSAIGIVDLCRVRLVPAKDAQARDAQGRLEPVGPAGSGGLASAARADGFVLVPAPLEGFAPGTRVEVFLFEAGGAWRQF